MGFFKDLKFGGGSIGLFDNSKFSPGNLLDLIKEGTFRTEGTFAPGYSNRLLTNATDFLKGQAKPEDGNPNTNKASDWSPTLAIKALSAKTESDSKRYKPGFLPPAYLSKQIIDKKIGAGKINEYSWNEDNAWIGHLLNSHLESPYYTQFESTFNSINTSQRIDEETVARTESEPYSARDYYIRFNDQNTDYFRHGLHIEKLTNLKSGKNARESSDGSGDSFRLSSFKESLHENNDPVIFGFEIIIDAVNSPLLNGSVEDFISEFSYISEVASRAIVIDDFKRQFMKVFKTKGDIEAHYNQSYGSDNIMINSQREGQVMVSNSKSEINNYANTPKQTNLYRSGKRAYMGYYLQKVDGLAALSESNTGEKKKYLADYKKDVIKLTFLEDLSLTMGSLAHMYKLLYWSKPNGKNIIPENLLRFNCDIVISECRNFNRVRKAANTGNLEIIKDNVSRYIYSLRECQFWFDKMSHEDTIDMGNVKTTDTFEVTFDYKYSSTKLEKWVPDPQKFGRYVGYNNGAIWKIGNKGSRADSMTTGQGKFVMKDNSVPRFYTQNTNTLRQNGVNQEIIMEAYKIAPETDEAAALPEAKSGSGPATTTNANPPSSSDSKGEDEEDKSKKKENRKKKAKEALEQFKKNAKDVAVKIAKGAAKFVFDEVNNQITIRARLLEDTINKARNLLGFGGLKNEPKRVYPRPYSPHSFGIFFDVRNDLFNFLGDEVAGVLAGGMQSLLPGTQLNVPFKIPNVGSKLKDLTGKFSLYDAEAKLIAALKSKGPKKPFFDAGKFKSKKWAGKTTNKIYNTNTEFKFPATTENVKFGGGFGVKALDYMKPKGNIYSDGKNKPAKMIDKYSNPLSNKFPIGIKDYNKIGFPNPAQKYPAPLIQGTGKLKDILGKNTVLKYSMDSLQFPVAGQKEPAPTTKGTGTLKDLLAKSVWKDVPGSMSNLQFPDSGQKFQAPVTAGNSTLKDLNAKSVWASTPGMMSGVQFPATAHKYPAPVKTGISDLKSLLASSKWNSVPGADKMSNLQFPTSAQKHLSPVTTGNSTLDQIVKSKSVVGSYGNSSYSNIQFPKAPQKFPAPISTGSKNIEQIVKSGTKWEYPVNNKKFGT